MSRQIVVVLFFWVLLGVVVPASANTLGPAERGSAKADGMLAEPKIPQAGPILDPGG